MQVFRKLENCGSNVALIGAVLLASAASWTSMAGELEPPGPPAPTARPLIEVEPRKLIDSLPFTISSPGSYYLAGALTGASGVDGITIDADDVTLDLNGFSLLGVAGSGHGIFSYDRTGVTIKNGTVANWGERGLSLAGLDTKAFLVADLVVKDNGQYGISSGPVTIIDTVASGNGQGGILCSSCQVTNCQAISNGSTGIQVNKGVIRGSVARDNPSGFAVVDGTIIDSAASDNAGDGIFAQRSNVANCTMNANGTNGIRATVSRIEGNVCSNNTDDGIEASNGDNMIVANRCDTNGAAGIRVTNGSAANVLDGNHVTNNNIGIHVTSAFNTMIRNVAKNNATNYLFSGTQDADVVVTSPIGAGPWDNFDF